MNSLQIQSKSIQEDLFIIPFKLYLIMSTLSFHKTNTFPHSPPPIQGNLLITSFISYFSTPAQLHFQTNNLLCSDYSIEEDPVIHQLTIKLARVNNVVSWNEWSPVTIVVRLGRSDYSLKNKQLCNDNPEISLKE